MIENPVCYNPEYRLSVIRSMSPVKRTSKVLGVVTSIVKTNNIIIGKINLDTVSTKH